MNIEKNMIVSSIFGLAIGDALGVPVEFVKRERLIKNPIKTMIGYGTHNQEPGTWSDDTSLTLALMDGLKSGYDINKIGQNMIDWFYNDQFTANNYVFDIGGTTKNAIDKLRSGISPLESGSSNPYNNGNGSLMRILPLAFYLYNIDFKNRKNIIYEVSGITHANIISKVACHFYIEFVIQLIKTKNIRESYELTANLFSEYYQESIVKKEFQRLFSGKTLDINKAKVKSSGYVVDTLEASIWCILHTNNYKDAVLTAVNLGDDTDTTGAVTGGLAGLIYGYDAIPDEWIKTLKNREYIYNICMEFSNTFCNDIFGTYKGLIEIKKTSLLRNIFKK